MPRYKPYKQIYSNYNKQRRNQIKKRLQKLTVYSTAFSVANSFVPFSITLQYHYLIIIDHVDRGATSKMGKRKSALVYVLTVIIFLLIIPEIILRVCKSEQLGRLSDFTSLGGLLNPLLSSLIFPALVSIILAAIAIAFVKRIFRKK